MTRSEKNPSNLEGTHSFDSPEDFVLQQHNDGAGIGKDEIARRYAQHYHNRAEPTQADFQFVDRVLTNREG